MKTIFFDFDGTLTHKGQNVWKKIWETLGYDTGKDSYYRDLFQEFVDKKITHKQWCDLTCEAFAEKGMNRQILKDIAGNVKLLDGVLKTFIKLKHLGFQIFIVSGNIIEVIEDVLGGAANRVDAIMANVFVFDEKGMLTKIAGTSYDFEGKAKFIEEYRKKTNTNANDLYFVGNGGNDEWAYLAGCHTICINPDGANYEDSTKWHKVIENITDLSQILPLLDIEDEISIE